MATNILFYRMWPKGADIQDLDIAQNDRMFLEQFSSIPLNYDNILREYISNYVRERSITEGDTPYYLDYYEDWISHTLSLVSDYIPILTKWCNDYLADIREYKYNNPD